MRKQRLRVAGTLAWDPQRVCGRAGPRRHLRPVTVRVLPSAEQTHRKAPPGKLLVVIKGDFLFKRSQPTFSVALGAPAWPSTLATGRTPSFSGCCQDFLFSSTSSLKFFHFSDVILRSRVYCLCFLPRPVAKGPLGLCPLSPFSPGAALVRLTVSVCEVAAALLISHPRAGVQTFLGAVHGPGLPPPRGQCLRSPLSTCFCPGLCLHCPPWLAM